MRPHFQNPSDPTEPIYADEFLLAVSKPAGLLAVPGRGLDKQDCLSLRVQRHFSDALIVHRLDMATSGLLLFARGIPMQRKLSEMFRERLIAKRYTAIVSGKMDPERGEITLPISDDWPNRPRQKIDEQGKPALTRFEVMEQDGNMARLWLEPVTGRTHQLRVHLMAINHPIVGDALYGGMHASRLMLHAQSLEFLHPVSKELMRLESEPPF